jgi:hypothetical protein
MCHKLPRDRVVVRRPTPSTAASECDQMSREMLIMAAGCIVCASLCVCGNESASEGSCLLASAARTCTQPGSAHGSQSVSAQLATLVLLL